MSKTFSIMSNPTEYIKLGFLMIILANPLFYLFVGSTIIDVENLFGSSIDRRSISFNSNDFFIQAMEFVVLSGFIMVILGLHFRRKSS